MTANQPEECPKTAAVLATHLDGDVAAACGDDGYSFASGPTLAEHLRDCAVCQRDLQRARRLDAALAAQAGHRLAALDRDLTARSERWFAAEEFDEAGDPAAASSADAATAAVPFAVSARTAWHRWRPLALGRATFVGALAGALVAVALWAALDAVPRSGPTRPTRTAAAPTAARQPVPPAGAAPPPAVAGGATAEALTEPALPPEFVGGRDSARRLARAPRPVAAHAPTAGELLQRFASPALPPPARLAALQALRVATRTVAAEQAAAGQALARLADLPLRSALDLQLHRAALAELRTWPAATNTLLARLNQLEVPGPLAAAGPLDATATVALAARWQDRDVDQALLRTIRRTPAWLDVVAAALRSGVRSEGAGRLLLDAWSDLATRSELHTDAGQLARAWFAGQPGDLFDELLDEFAASRIAQRRQICLLALGHCPDARALATLLQVVAASHRGEAMAAAYALAHLPHALLEPLVARALDERDGLLRAALASAGLPATRAWLRDLPWNAAERARFADPSWTDFPLLVTWLRERPRPSGS